MVFKKDIQFDLLKYIHQQNKQVKPFSQRDIAKALSISVGMANEIIKKAFETGFLKIKRLNAKTLHYLLTIEGIQYVLSKTQKYMKRIVKNAALYKDAVDALICDKINKGVNKIILAGHSDIEFIIEYCCYKHGIMYEHVVNLGEINNIDTADTRSLILFSENSFFSNANNNREIVDFTNEIVEILNDKEYESV